MITNRRHRRDAPTLKATQASARSRPGPRSGWHRHTGINGSGAALCPRASGRSTFDDATVRAAPGPDRARRWPRHQTGEQVGRPARPGHAGRVLRPSSSLEGATARAAASATPGDRPPLPRLRPRGPTPGSVTRDRREGGVPREPEMQTRPGDDEDTPPMRRPRHRPRSQGQQDRQLRGRRPQGDGGPRSPQLVPSSNCSAREPPTLFDTKGCAGARCGRGPAEPVIPMRDHSPRMVAASPPGHWLGQRPPPRRRARRGPPGMLELEASLGVAR